MADINYVTGEGLERMKKELAELKTKGRSSMAKQIQEAREKGDLSENAEYDAAKDAQGMLEMKISQLESIVSNSRVIDESKLDFSKVGLLTTVKVRNGNTKKENIYSIVPENDADLKNGKISANSPIGKGLIGKAVGEVAEVTVPAGKIKFEILSIGKI